MRLAQAILFANDLGVMKAFYRDAFGLTILEDDPGYVRLDSGGAVLMLHKLGEPPSPTPRCDSFIKLCFKSDDVPAARAALVARGVAMRDLHHFGAVTLCDGVDPEGNIFQITTR
jgi:predicted enzyme related to lactoylglutathione lyase